MRDQLLFTINHTNIRIKVEYNSKHFFVAVEALNYQKSIELKSFKTNETWNFYNNYDYQNCPKVRLKTGGFRSKNILK